MTSQMMTHQRNMESSLLFLQQEHANTLKALHDEISKLQKKCSELTFEMAMVTPDTDKDDYGRIKRLESDLEVQKKENKELQQDSEKKDKRMKMLEQQLRAQEKKFQDELKAKNVTINTLKRELDSKSNNIAFLTTEMHRIKKRVTDGDQNVSDKVIPTPPRDGAPRPRRSAQKRVELGSTNIHGAVVTRRPLRGTSGRNRGVARPESPAEIPDPAPFLQRNTIAKKEVMIKPTPPPLPPISAHAIDSVRNSGGPVVFRSARADTRTVPTRLQAGAPSPEVETLAVDQVPGTSATGKWGRAHESKSTEYN